MCSDGEYPVVFKENWRTARKIHVCCECGSDIDKGETYQDIKGFWPDSGGWLSYKTCEVCAKIRNAAQEEIYENIVFECLYETVGSEFEDAAI